MRFKLTLAAGAIAAAVATIAYAQTDVIAERQDLMEANGAAMGTLVQMVRGQAPFDAAAAKAALEKIATDMETFPTLFPVGSESGGGTKAGPAIWSDPTGFQAASDQLKSDATAAAGAVTTLEDLQTAVGVLGADCGSCHQKYRS